METDGTADCQRARDCAGASEVLEDAAEARLLRADSDDSQEVHSVFEHLELDVDLALLEGEILVNRVHECFLVSAGRWRCPRHTQVEERSLWCWVPGFRILHGQVPSSQVFRLWQHPAQRIFPYVPPHARQIDLLLRLLCPRHVGLCADDQLLHADPVSGHALPFGGLDQAQGRTTHVRAYGHHPLDGACLFQPLARAQYWPSRSRLCGCLLQGQPRLFGYLALTQREGARDRTYGPLP